MPTIYTDTSKLPERREHDFYPTPFELCRESLFLLPHNFTPDFVLDTGYGTGVWGEALRVRYGEEPNLLGIDIQCPPTNDSYNMEFIDQDYLKVELSYKFDLIMGNPPYKFLHEFIDKSFSLLEDNGYLLYLTRLAILESKIRYKKYYSKNLNPKEVWVCVKRPSFMGDKKTGADAYAVSLWQKGFIGDTKLKWLDWSYDD